MYCVVYKGPRPHKHAMKNEYQLPTGRFHTPLAPCVRPHLGHRGRIHTAERGQSAVPHVPHAAQVRQVPSCSPRDRRFHSREAPQVERKGNGVLKTGFAFMPKS